MESSRLERTLELEELDCSVDSVRQILVADDVTIVHPLDRDESCGSAKSLRAGHFELNRLHKVINNGGANQAEPRH